MRFDVITLFPDQFRVLSQEGVVARALKRGIAELRLWNPRDFTTDVHRTVDDRPYGGGPGMVMKVEPLRAAIEAARRSAKAAGSDSRVAYLSPQGRLLDQARMARIADQAKTGSGWILVAGRYEGIDERLIAAEVDEEWSIGDYVLSGGELPAMVVMDAVIRLLPGTLGHVDSARQDSHADGLLDCPHYTRPETLDGVRVPDVLLSGDHAAIARWRLQQSLGRTWRRRPELLARRTLSAEQQVLLDAFIQAHRAAECETRSAIDPGAGAGAVPAPDLAPDRDPARDPAREPDRAPDWEPDRAPAANLAIRSGAGADREADAGSSTGPAGRSIAEAKTGSETGSEPGAEPQAGSEQEPTET